MSPGGVDIGVGTVGAAAGVTIDPPVTISKHNTFVLLFGLTSANAQHHGQSQGPEGHP